MANRSPVKSGGGGSRNSRNSFGGGVFSIMRDEWVFMRILLPYMSMLFGMFIILFLAAMTRVFIYIDARWLGKGDHLRIDTIVVTGAVVVSAAILCPLAWVFWGQRKAVIIKEHALLTVLLGHAWWIIAVWENYGSWMFNRYAFFLHMFGCVVIGLSWCFRNWAVSKIDDDTAMRDGGFSDIGLGDGTHLGKKVIDGETLTATMFMGPGKTADDAKASRGKIAALAGKPLTQVHVRDHKSGDFDKAEVVILRKNPFENPRELRWAGPQHMGESIALPISYATYEDSTRAELHLAGHKGGSSQHFLCMGMSGTGKSKCWQCIYGDALTRTEFNLIYIDPIKGFQTAGPLLKGIDLFADSLAKGQRVLERVETAITERTNYLTSRGLDQWEPGCGINFLVVHIEEAGRFAKTKRLVELVEAARSAGIMLVFSLQRAQGSRLDTNTRYNLGGSMCFGTYGVRDAEFALSEYTRQSGAIPHHWQDRYPGRHYLEAHGIDPRKFALSLQVDWIETQQLKEVIDEGAQFHTPMDEVTANALGEVYQQYQTAVATGDTAWQQMEKSGLWVKRNADTEEIPPVTGEPDNGPVSISAEEAQRFLWEWLCAQRDAGIESLPFKNIAEAASPVCLRQAPWINQQLKKWIRSGHLPAQTDAGEYVMPVRRERGA